MKGHERRVRRLEIQDMGEGRVIVLVWPDGNVQDALQAHGIEERPDDLIVRIDKGRMAKAGWVSVDGTKLCRRKA